MSLYPQFPASIWAVLDYLFAAGLLIVAAVLVVGSISETCTPPAKKKRGQTPNPARCAASALRERAGAPSEHSSSVAAAAPPSSADGSYDVSMLRSSLGQAPVISIESAAARNRSLLQRRLQAVEGVGE
eukprot:Tamp_37904.p2 GENE.Tamp_37904~~Tamp_37904.p2  ORF type:complete len:129 (+),score=19.00 Tamp_37904:78-464(+)